MTEDEAQVFCDQRKAEVDRWQVKREAADPVTPGGKRLVEQPYVAVSYWKGADDRRQPARRIHCVGGTLAEAVAACKAREAG